MSVLLPAYGSGGDFEPMVGLAARLRALGAELLARRMAELVAAVGEGCDALAAGGTMPSGSGGWL